MIIRKIKQEELLAARGVSSVAFDWSFDTAGLTPEGYAQKVLDNPGHKAEACCMDTWVALADDGALAAKLQCLPYTVFFDGGEAKMSGVGGVCSLPQYRRQGAVREMFKAAYEELLESGVLFSHLFAFSEHFYARYGYVSCMQAGWTFDMHTVPDYAYGGSFTMYRGGDEFPALQEVYTRFACRYNMMAHRNKDDWKRYIDADPLKDTHYTYLYRDTAGHPKGYLTYRKVRENNMDIFECSEFVANDKDALRALFAFAKSFSSHFKKIRLSAPRDLPLEGFCLDYSQSESKRALEQNGMARAVNAEKILLAAKYRGSGTLSVAIKDPDIAQNNRTFRIAYENGRASEVRTAETGIPDAEMSVNRFTAAILGLCAAEDFEYFTDAKLHCDAEKAAGVFYRKPYWINDHF